MRRLEVGVADVFRTCLSADFSPILIKGWAAARNYPVGITRSSSDIDIAVSAGEHAAMLRFAIDPVFSRFATDIHKEFRHYDLTPWDILFERSDVCVIDDVPVRILCAEDHLRVLCVHWLNDGGAYKDRLWDIVYAVQNRPSTFDWDLCLNSVPVHRRKWVTTAISIARRHCDLSISDLPLTSKDLSIPDWLEKALKREWRSTTRLRPIHTVHNNFELLKQLRKRIPPNPIQATIEGEGKFDDGWRVPMQIRTGLARIVPSLVRLKPRILPKESK